jgi:hypothetical protein
VLLLAEATAELPTAVADAPLAFASQLGLTSREVFTTLPELHPASAGATIANAPAAHAHTSNGSQWRRHGALGKSIGC